jgi:protein-S-isoprenylcysteine O-methyltransferase Ste14
MTLGGPTPLAATATLLTVVAFFGLDELVVRRTGGRVRSVRTESDRRTFLWIQAWQVAALVVALGSPFWVDALDLPTWVWPIGIAIAWAGIALRLWAVSTLGSQFSRVVGVEAGAHVEDRGPYRFVRHPSYSAVLLAFAGIGVAQANVLSAVGAVVCILIGYVARIRVEEGVLEAELGDAYRDYAATRARLVPGVW